MLLESFQKGNIIPIMTNEKNEISVLGKAIKNVLKPLARLLIKYEIDYTEFSEYSKQAFAEAAYDYYKLPNKKMTFARVSVLTGLSRKQVIRILSDNENKVPAPKIAQSRTSRVILGWISDPQFCENGEPKDLPLRHGEDSFNKLVEKYSGDMSPRSVLDEMVVSKTATKVGDRLRLINSGGTPPEDDLEKFRVLSISAADLLGTGVHNLCEDNADDLRFQREYVRNNVPEGLVKEFKAHTNKHSQALFEEYVSWIRNRAKEYPQDENEETKRIGIGIYYFEEDKPKSEE